MNKANNIFTIPAGIPFAKALAARLLEEHEQSPETLPDILILLPTRRAARTLREAFLQLNNGKPLMLPRMQALGDIDEEELSLSIAGTNGTQQLLNLPPVLPPLQRQILLSKAIIAHDDFPHGFDQALSLAKTLGHLIDQIDTEDLDIKDLASIVPENFADHWQVTLDFLKILSEQWPKALETLNVIDAAKRRNILINTLADFWDETKPQTRIIVAGTTASIPATAKLVKVITTLPNSQIILPGLDQNCDEKSWNAFSESHPQYGFKLLLDHIGTSREKITNWPTPTTDTATSNARRTLCTELMRPAKTTQEWQKIITTPNTLNACTTATQNLQLFEADTPQQEAQIIAALMRSILEQPTKTAALITPDRNLAKRVAMACRRWNITIDDSAGLPLNQTAIGRFLMLTIETSAQDLSPVTLMALLKHPLVQSDLQTNLNLLETTLLRGTKPPAGINGLYDHLAKQTKKAQENNKPDHSETITPIIQTLETIFTPMLEIFASTEKIPFKTILQTHIELCENLHGGDTAIWNGEAGNAAAELLSKLLDQAAHFPSINTYEYPQILQQFMASETLRPAYGTHPRLQILGQLEARLIDADLVILGGLNEGTWPPDPGHDPWMSRPMRKDFGLPSSDRSIGLAAHDFTQGLCAPNVAITRSKLNDGAPTIPARWLDRLETVLSASNIDIKSLSQNDIHQWVNTIDKVETLSPNKRPEPKPPKSTRPRKLPITKIETWLKDPYSIYAYSILRLSPLDPLEKQADAAIRGQILHDTLDDFIKNHPHTIPTNAADTILETAKEKVTQENQAAENWHFYWPRFAKIAEQYIEKETKWREHAAPLKTEIKGQMTLTTAAGDFLLYGRADRIDKTHDNNGAIIDYKTGGTFSKSGMTNGDSPQLPLEGLILQEGGFENIPPTPCEYLGYWMLNTNNKDTEQTNSHDILVDTKHSLVTLIETFDNDDIPYYALPRATKMLRFHDYEHLARVKEWAALDDAEEVA